MQSKQIVLTLGYIAIFCVALYFVFGILQISGHGLTGMVGGPMIEGMTDKQREKAEKDVEEANTTLEKLLEDARKGMGKAFLNMDDDIDGFDEFQENFLTLADYSLEAQKNMLMSTFLQQLKTKKNINLNDKNIQEQMTKIVNLYNFKKFLEEHKDVQV